MQGIEIYTAAMKFPYEKLINFDDNVYELTSAVIVRSSQVTQLRTIYGKDYIGAQTRVDAHEKSVVIALEEVLTDTVRYKFIAQ